MNLRGKLGVIAACAVALLWAPAADASGGGVIVHELSGGDGSSAKLRGDVFRNAEPLPMPSAPAPSANPGSGSSRQATGKPTYVEGHIPAHLAVADATMRTGSLARGFGKFTSNAVAEPTVYPNTTNGRVIGKIKGVGIYGCSASVVHSKNKSTIFTAGHCVKDPGKRGKFAKRLAFAPAYSKGSTLGVWEAKTVVVNKAWAKKGNLSYDYAAAVLKPEKGQMKVEAAAGSKGFAVDVPIRKQELRAVGYPFNKQKAEVMWECNAKFGGFDPGSRGLDPKPIGIGCDMTEGASGGGWTIPGDYLTSVSSFTYPALPDRLYGPYFTKAANKVRKKAGRVPVR